MGFLNFTAYILLSLYFGFILLQYVSCVTQCPDPGVPENGNRRGGRLFTVGSSVRFRCFKGFTLLGSVRRECMPNGQWSGELTSCNMPRNYCPNPGVPIKGFRNSTDFDMGSKVGFRCKDDYLQIGSEVRECLSDHTWSGTEMKCLGIFDFDNKEVIKDRLTTTIALLRNRNLQGRVLNLDYPVRTMLYFVFDVSPTVGAQNFAISIEFAKAIVKKVGISENGTRAGALTFGSGANEQFFPLHYNTTEEVLYALDRINYISGGYFSYSSAFHLLRNDFLPLVEEWSGRRNVKSVIFLITGGKVPLRGIQVEDANILKENGVEIHCIGMTGDLRRKYLYDLASKSKNNIGEEYPNVYILQNYATLSWLVQEINRTVADFETGCKLPEIVKGDYGKYVDSNFQKVDKTVAIKNKQTLTLRCHEGYVPFSRQGNNSTEGAFEEEITCENGTWSKKLSCVESDKISTCSYVPRIETNEPALNSSYQRRSHGHVITYAVWDDSILVEKGKAVCHFGKWIFSSELKNKSITCPMFENPQGIEVIYTADLFVGSHAFFICSPGNILQSIYAVCLSNGTWSHSLPSCKEPVICQMFEPRPSLEISYPNGFSIGSKARFTCLPPLVLDGASEATCMANGLWSHTLPKCIEPVICQTFEPRPSLEISYPNGFSIGSKASFTCSPPLVLDGATEATCMANGLWSHSLPKCIGVLGCILKKPETSVLNIQPEKPFYTFGEKVILWCPSRMILSPSVQTLMCLGSQWSDDLPDCENSF